MVATSIGDASSRRIAAAPLENAVMNRLVTGTVAAFCVSVTVAWWVMLVRGALWLVLD
jgi:hypothetical protein